MSLRVDIRKNMGDFQLDVAFEAGDEVLGFLGASGCGKSLTMRCIAGIEQPDEGVIEVNGKVFFDRAHDSRRAKVNLTPQQRKTALLFQNYMLFPNLTVGQNVAAGIGRDVPSADRDKIVTSHLRRFGLEGMESRYPMQLSGGQQQRVALARMLAARPGILMLDEPFSALDAHLKSSLEQNLIGLFKEFEGTVLYVSHDIDEAFRFCDRIAVVDGGRIDEIGSKRSIVDDPQSLAAIKLSGCKNTTEAYRVDGSTVHLPQWGIRVKSARPVADDVRYFGVKAFCLERSEGPGVNCFRVRADRVSDSRFERTVMLAFPDGEKTPERLHDLAEEDETMKFLRTHLQWRVDKLGMDERVLPREGDEFYIRIPPDAIHLVSR